ncbi:MAG: sigma-54-dependent Fis family transcriptional regulator [Deltaproteobacteria bacterium]|nr:sigma-54-dependent Fis family transcriptional regulator [Deltaproteobacteria bacterium]
MAESNPVEEQRPPAAPGERPHVLVVDDAEMMRAMLARELPRRGCRVSTAGSGEEGVRLAQSEDFAVAIVDILMPGLDGMETLKRLRQESPATEVVLLTGHGTIEGAVAGMRSGAYDYLTKPCRLSELSAVLRRAVEHRALRRENAALKRLVSSGAGGTSMVAASGVMRDLMARLERVAPTDSPVLIQGESGTGKELVARLLHRQSGRRDKPFVVINCTAIPDSLFESELFGHQRGAFTGAVERRLGLVEAADGGTLFLDEVGEMNPAAQAKLLRTLESGEIRRVGENRTSRVDVRVVAATNKRLANEVAAGRFREDLYYRLNGVPLHIPPLRDRGEDVEALVQHFLMEAGKHPRVTGISAEALAELRAYAWPGNVRELKNCVQALRILAIGSEITLDDLPPHIRTARPKDGNPWDRRPILELAQVTEDYILYALERCGGNKSQAARLLGIDPKTLYKRLRRQSGDAPLSSFSVGKEEQGASPLPGRKCK